MSSKNYNAVGRAEPRNRSVQADEPLQPITLTVPPGYAGKRLDQALARLAPQYSRSRLAVWIREGRVSVDNRAAEPKHKLRGGEAVTVAPATDPQVLAFRPEKIPLDIVHEDGAILVIDKPAGLVVHPGSGNWQGTLLNALLQHAPAQAHLPRAGIVHRLDKDTSGLLVVAKTLAAQTHLVRQLQAHTMGREYLAVASGRIEDDGTIDEPIGRHPKQRTRMAVVARGKPAVTHVEVLEVFEHATLVRCRLETGRTHQIRVHLAAAGHPLVGDPVYGGRKRTGVPEFGRQALHAERLSLTHPVTGRLRRWRAPPPDDLAELIATLREGA